MDSKFSKRSDKHREVRRESEGEEVNDDLNSDQLARLENIVYGKVIPILQTDLDC
jgi:hypothetical protein